MKTKHMAKWAVLALTAMLAWACSDPVSNTNTGGGAVGDTPPGIGSVGGTDGAKVTFEGTTVSLTAGDVYSPKDALTTPDAGLTVSQDSSFFYAGTKSLKMTATVQQDKYDNSAAGTLNSPPKVTEFGARIKVGTIANSGATLDLTDKIVTVRVFIPTGSPSTGVQFVLQSNNQQAIGPALSVAAGKWTSLSFKADSTKVNAAGKLMLTSVTSAGAFDKNGAYSSSTFEATAVDQVEIRAVGGAVGAAGTLYVDSIEWAAAPSFSATSSPVITDTSASGTGTDKVTVTLAAGTSGADSIYYTLNGDEPTTASTLYSAPFDVTASSTLKTLAVKSGLANSAVASKAYTIVVSKAVSFDLNYSGATGAPATQKVTPSTAATAPAAPTRSGYTFVGWFADAAGTGSAFDFATLITADTPLFAKWTSLPTYTVTFQLNYTGASGGPAAQTIQSGNAISVPSIPTLAGYSFAGWTTDAAGATAFASTTPVTADTTLYAKWTVATASSLASILVSNFESATAGATFDTNGAIAAADQTNLVNSSSGNKYLKWSANASYAVPKFPVSLPSSGSNLSDYDYVTFDLGISSLAGETHSYKAMQLYAVVNGTATKLFDAGSLNYGSAGKWVTYSIAIPKSGVSTTTGKSFDLQVGIADNTTTNYFAIDNIKLVKKVAVADFEADAVGTTYPLNSWYGTGAGTTAVALVSSAAGTGNTSTNALTVKQAAQYNNAMATFSVTLPTGKTIASYRTILVDVWAPNEVAYQYKDFIATMGASAAINILPTGGAQELTGYSAAWKTLQITIPAGLTSTTTLDLRLGIQGGTATGAYYLDNILLLE